MVPRVFHRDLMALHAVDMAVFQSWKVVQMREALCTGEPRELRLVVHSETLCSIWSRRASLTAVPFFGFDVPRGKSLIPPFLHFHLLLLLPHTHVKTNRQIHRHTNRS